VSFPVDLHSAAVFDSHMPCRVYDVPMPFHDHAVLKRTSQDHDTARHGHGMCELAGGFITEMSLQRGTDWGFK
jgi:hypothetical protein